MTLTPGKRLGPYEIFSAIGAGGMGEAQAPEPINVELNWFEMLKRQNPAGNK